MKARIGWKALTAREYVDEGVMFLSTPNIKTNDIDFDNTNFITQFRYDESPELKLQVGDVLIAKDGSTLGITNVVRHLPGPATVNGSIAVVRSIGMEPRFLRYVLASEFTQGIIGTVKAGMGVPHLFQADLRKFPIPRPPIGAQRVIADFLDTETARIDALIAAKSALSAKIDEHADAKVNLLVIGAVDAGVGKLPHGWRTAQLRNVIESISDGPFGSTLASKHYADDGVRVIRLGNIGQGRFLDADRAYVPVEYADGPLAKSRVDAGDVVMAGLGDERRSIGRGCVVPDSLQGAVHKADCFRIRCSALVRAEYLVAYLSSSTGAEACALLSQGTTRQRINTTNARSVPVLVPPLEEQDRIVEEVGEIRLRQKSIVGKLTAQLGLLVEHRQALITIAVTQQLDEATLNGTRPLTEAIGMEVPA